MVEAQNFQNLESEFKTCDMSSNIRNSKLNSQIPLGKLKLNQKSYYFLQISAFWGLKILNLGIILKTFTHGFCDKIIPECI